MHLSTFELIGNASRIHGVVNHESRIHIDLSLAGLSEILAAMYCLIDNKVGDPASIYRYLNERKCRYDREMVDFLLNAYEGADPSRHLWTRTLSGDYIRLVDGDGDFFPC